MKKENLDNMDFGHSLALPRSRGVQRHDVWEAADAVLLQGGKPTIERVRQHLGTGSPNTVGPHLEQWFKHLGKRIKDPGAFAAPHGVPDPVLQMAQHFWENALAQTRSDFDERLREGLSEAESAVENEKKRAEMAVEAADEATTRANLLKSELNQTVILLGQAREDLAAQHARLDEVRGAWALANDQLKEEREEMAKNATDIKQQLLSAVDRADAADRRVALELDRERTARAKAERQVETLQKSLNAVQVAALANSEQARQAQQLLTEREDALKARLAAKVAELDEERRRVNELHADSAVKALAASEAQAQAREWQDALARLSKLVESSAQRKVKLDRRRVGKAFVPRKKI